jgi:hypothetical protein
MKLKLTFALAIATLLVSFPASAQTKIQYFSAFSKGGVIPKECAQEIAIITPMIAKYHGPAGWTWIVACDEIAWQHVEQHMGQIDVQGRILASTDLAYHITYVRGDDVIHPVNLSAAYGCAELQFLREALG